MDARSTSETLDFRPGAIVRGAVAGLLAWLTYGLVEFVLVYFSQRSLMMSGLQWRLLAILIGTYGLFGAASGGLMGFALKWTGRAKRDNDRIASALVLVVVFLANLFLGWPVRPREYLALATALALATVFAATLIQDREQPLAKFLARPWIVSLLLLVSPWISFDVLSSSSGITRNGASVLLMALILTGAGVWQRFGRKADSGWFGQRLVFPVVLIGALAGFVIWQSRRPSLDTNASARGDGASKCNIVLITLDTVRPDHLSVYGYTNDTTPALRELGRSSTVYRRAMASAGMTLPTHASIFTSLYPDWHGAVLSSPAYPLGRPLADRHATLAETLRAKGYRTGALVANWAYLNSWFGFAQGFDSYDVLRPVRFADSDRPFYIRESARRLLKLVMDTRDFDVKAFRAATITDRALSWVNDANDGRPFLLFLNYMSAHMPYVPPPSFDRFAGKTPEFSGWESVADLKRDVLSGKHRLTDLERSHLVSQYDGAIAYLDAEIGRLLQGLREAGKYENTMIVITSDHGEAFGEHNLLEHATGQLYMNEVHVALLIKRPGQRTGIVSDALASHVDLMPTILAAAQVPAPPGLQGRALDSKESDESRVIFAAARTFPSNAELSPRFKGVRRAVFSGEFKLITWTHGTPELYNLAADPNETRNLYKEHDPLSEALMRPLLEWTAGIPRETGPGSKPDNSQVERIKSLGYAQ